MNTIPSIFNQHKVPYTVYGGKRQPEPRAKGVTCIVLSRKSKYLRSRAFNNVLSAGFQSVISVNGVSEKDNIAEEAGRFPAIRFLLSGEDVTQGELLNIAFSEVQTPYALVMPEELCIDRFNFTPSLAAHLMQRRVFCVVPSLFSASRVALPVCLAPGARKSSFTVRKSSSFSDRDPTLYAFDYAGLYDTQKFILLGGFDYTIKSPYWQKLDAFFRSWLWGEQTILSSSFEATYAGPFPEEDETVDLSSLRFYLKNLAPVFRTDHAAIPPLSYFTFKRRNSCGFAESLRQFKDAREWVEENKYRFKTDAVRLIESWPL